MLLHLFRRLTTRAIWNFERTRSYPVRQKVDNLPSIPVVNHDSMLAVLTTGDAFCDAIWAGWSWTRYLGDKFELVIFVDGQVSLKNQEIASKILPGVRIECVKEKTRALRDNVPELNQFCNTHRLGLKLALVLLLQSERNVLYSDHDVIAFNQPVEILSHVANNKPFFIQEESVSSYDTDVLERASKLHLNAAEGLNSGLMFAPKDSLSITEARNILRDLPRSFSSWFTEQTIFGVLFNSANAIPLPKNRYVVSNRRQFYWDEDIKYEDIVARHFTSPVRHVLYRKAMPFILQKLSGTRK